MPSKDRYLSDLMEAYLAALQRNNRGSPTTARKYRKVLTLATNAWLEAGLEATPKRVGEEEIEHLLHEAWAHLEWSTLRWQVSIINGYLKWYQNRTVERMLLSWPADDRVHVDWVSPEEAVTLLDGTTGVQRLIVHLELRLWLRRCEVLRLTVQDVSPGILDVLGKGKCGGKRRTLAWAPETMGELVLYADQRNRMIAEAMECDPCAKVPDALLIWRKGGTLGAYHATAVDNLVLAAGNRCGISRPLSNHMLRRGGARIAYYAGMELEEISAGLGHRDVRTTIRYLGLTVDDLAKGQEKCRDYLDQVRKGMVPEAKPAPPFALISR
jgi:site-specific recombinase XerD